jgi:3-keto-5-aminohexanoate cleavage enzyme
MDPLVITVASTNINWTKKDSPYVPETPEEIAEDIVKAYREGASVAHIHARDENGKTTFHPKYFQKIIEPAPIEEKLALIRELRPDRASLNIRGSQKEIEHTSKVMRDLEVSPVIEAFNIEMIEKANQLIKTGLVQQPAHFELVFDLVSESNKSLFEDYEEMLKRIKALHPGSLWSRNHSPRRPCSSGLGGQSLHGTRTTCPEQCRICEACQASFRNASKKGGHGRRSEKDVQDPSLMYADPPEK